MDHNFKLDVMCTEDISGMKTFASTEHPMYKISIIGQGVLDFGVIMINDLIIYQGSDIGTAINIFNDYYVAAKEYCSLTEELQKEISNYEGLNLSTEIKVINQDEEMKDVKQLTSIIYFGKKNPESNDKLYVSLCLYNGHVRLVFKKSGEVKVVPRSGFNPSEVIDEFIMSI